MNVTQFLERVQQNVSRVKVYKPGGDGTNGECDCIGLIIGALRLGGVKWTGTHGTNYAVRNEMRWCSTLTKVSQLKKGMVVYKSREPGSNGYSLPEKYEAGGDLLDYYHVGVVTQINPLVITHCTSPGPIVRDSKLGKWNWYGELKKVDPVDEEEEVSHMKTMYVVGGRLNLRSGPSTQNATLAQMPTGSMVQAEQYNDTWSRVQYTDAKGKTYSGYAVSEYLSETAPDGDAPAPVPETVTLVLERDVAEKLKKVLEDVL